MNEHLTTSRNSLHKDRSKDKENSGLKHLHKLAEEQQRLKHPTVPVYALPPVKYSDKKANGLTRCIIDFVKLHGYQAERISVTGRYIDQSKIVTDILGGKKCIGTGKWIPGTMQSGSADISATIQGRSVKIEVKISKDRQSEAQKIYQQQVEQAGGIYFIARDFQSFYDWFISTFQKGGAE